MVYKGNYLTLYVASGEFPGTTQYQDSQRVLEMLQKDGVKYKIGIKPLDSDALVAKVRDGYFKFIVGRDEKVSLPLLETMAVDGGIFTGFMGLDEVVRELERLNVLEKAQAHQVR